MIDCRDKPLFGCPKSPIRWRPVITNLLQLDAFYYQGLLKGAKLQIFATSEQWRSAVHATGRTRLLHITGGGTKNFIPFNLCRSLDMFRDVELLESKHQHLPECPAMQAAAS